MQILCVRQGQAPCFGCHPAMGGATIPLHRRLLHNCPHLIVLSIPRQSSSPLYRTAGANPLRCLHRLIPGIPNLQHHVHSGVLSESFLTSSVFISCFATPGICKFAILTHRKNAAISSIDRVIAASAGPVPTFNYTPINFTPIIFSGSSALALYAPIGRATAWSIACGQHNDTSGFHGRSLQQAMHCGGLPSTSHPLNAAQPHVSPCKGCSSW